MKQKKITIVFVSLVAIILAAVIIFDTVLKKEEYQKTDYAMGAVISQRLTGKSCEDTAKEITAKIKDLEKVISWRVEGSEVAELNSQKFVEVSPETEKIFEDIVDVCKKSNGAIDLTVGKLTRLWNIGSDEFILPEQNLIEKELENIGFEKVKIENSTISVDENQFVDLGFVGKGIACDEAKEVLEKSEIKEAVISVGGSLCLFGKGTFDVGIRNPLGDVNEYMAVLEVGECFISTSGNYERFSEYDGKKYHHILSTQTGYPVENNLLSVTIVCSSGLLSDALSTACYCLGYEESIELLQEYKAEAVFIFDDNTVKVTDGLKDKIEIENDEFKLWKEN